MSYDCMSCLQKKIEKNIIPIITVDLSFRELGKHRKIYCKREIRVNLSLTVYLLTQEY